MNHAHKHKLSPARVGRRAANLSVDAGLLAEAKALGISLSGALEETLRAKVAEAKQAAWLKENADAIASHNERVARKGLFSDKLRRF
jgi:antitoxin CcdA